MFWKLRLPSAMPSIFTAVRFAAGLGLAAAYYGEGGTCRKRGLGDVGRRAHRTHGYVLWATIVCARPRSG